MFKNFIKQYFHNLFALIIKLTGFKSLCWVIATIAFFNGLMSSWEWIAFSSVVIGAKFVKAVKGLYPTLNFKK